MTPADNPYLSVVVTARNDDHGGGFLRRMQAFVSGFLEQCTRHQLPAEIIVVEWNPPADRGPLRDALAWPISTEWCRVRFIEVPPEIHCRYPHAAKVGLYQMTAKNVGIRRAKAEYVLATNIDIFFNDELMQFFAQRKLERGKMYRIDRYDAASDFRDGAPVSEQLAYSASHILRISAREATFPLNELGHRTWPGKDIADARLLSLEGGWHAPEVWLGSAFRNVDDGAEILIPPTGEATELGLQVDPGAAVGGPVKVTIERVNDGGPPQLVAEAVVDQMSWLRMPVPASAEPVRFCFRIQATRTPAGNRNILLLRAWRVTLGRLDHRSTSKLVAQSLGFADKVAIAMRRDTPRLHAALAPTYRAVMGMKDDFSVVEREPSVDGPPKLPPTLLHTNACGDFTLLHQDHWDDLRGYPEFDAYSMNIDAIFCWVAYHAGFQEEMLRDPMRIYHMEHGAGWTPEGSELLYNRIRQMGLPWLDYHQVLGWERDMRQWNLPMIFNLSNWGLGDDELRETVVTKI